ncbi:zinc finger double-stranded RNA-binding protein [Aquimarina sp. MAR_2010_214]|uniref:C2H2-type zinc finger protein n=1 Tax=Aquimarina sp. MAR_2010_214 TaxID=1250026 RepID=UPI000C705368|nr:C2H2-type zinc finger protein [Aquimarina sp. MAR_2010_214]PKV50869.1 zinc finger double-stranded RNA-binding protein [Aquimarina sp. MAR_2010_214]
MKQIITKEWFGILALTIILIPQVAHTVYVFSENSQYDNPWFAWFYAAGVDLAILIFTVRGWKKTAFIYLLGTIAHNVVYQFYPESVYSSILIAIMLSGTIFSFSHLFYADKPKDESQEEKLDVFTQLQEHHIELELKPYRCPECQKSFANTKQLNGHISGHKQTQQWNDELYGDWEEQNDVRSLLLQQLHLTPLNGQSDLF